MKYKKIAFVGMMGSGKSTVSKLLASKLNFKLFEMDEILENDNKIKIADFFKKFGEEEFRKKETALLYELSKENSFVLSTGGGIILKAENRNILYSSDIFTIYLKASCDVIYDRIKDDKSRPLLLVDNPGQEIKKILMQREAFYSLSNLTLNVDHKTQVEIVEDIISYL